MIVDTGSRLGDYGTVGRLDVLSLNQDQVQGEQRVRAKNQACNLRTIFFPRWQIIGEEIDGSGHEALERAGLEPVDCISGE